MITDSFDKKSQAIINPIINQNAVEVDACIITFSDKIELAVLNEYHCEKIGSFRFVTGETPIYLLRSGHKKFAFFKTYVGGPACVGTIEDSLNIIKTKHFILFGGAGCLRKEISKGKVMVPIKAYRDEGTSYHYVAPSDYISIKNYETVAEFMRQSRIPYVCGDTWTTDAFYRETKNNFEKHKKDGCISVEMECASVQAMCDWRGLELYVFFTGGDLLDAPEWDSRQYGNSNLAGSQHDPMHFNIALKLADYISDSRTT